MKVYLKKIASEIREELNDDNILLAIATVERMRDNTTIKIRRKNGKEDFVIEWTDRGFQIEGYYKWEVIPFLYQEPVRNHKGECLDWNREDIEKFKKEFIEKVRKEQEKQYDLIAVIPVHHDKIFKGENHERVEDVAGQHFTDIDALIFVDKDIKTYLWAYKSRRHFRKRIKTVTEMWTYESGGGWKVTDKSKTNFIPLDKEDVDQWLQFEKEKVKRIEGLASDEMAFSEGMGEMEKKRYLRGTESPVDFPHHWEKEKE